MTSDFATSRGTWKFRPRGTAPACRGSRSCGRAPRPGAAGRALRGPPGPSKVAHLHVPTLAADRAARASRYRRAGPLPSPELVTDHHPARPASLLSAFHDVGDPAGATSTLVTQYLRAARLVPNPTLATALFYGIKSDTRDLGREVEGADVDCYNWLFPHVDKQALSRIEHPQVPARYFAAYHNAYERARLHGNGQACVVHLGDVYVPEIVPEVAERLVSLEALRWSLATGSYKGELYLSLRLNDRRFNAGKIVREVCSTFGGSAGGHGAMAGARIPLDGRGPAVLGQQLAMAFLKVFRLRGGPG